MIALAACAAIAVGVPFAWSLGALAGADMIDAAVSGAQDLAELLGQRSPGARTQGELTKTKRVHASPKLRAQPRHPAGASPAARPKADSPTELATLLQSPPAPAGLTPNIVEAALVPPPSLGTILASVPGAPGAPGIAPPGSSGTTSPGYGGRPATFPTAEPREPLPSPGAVPEPGTWATMLLGFGLLGWRLRRRTTARPRTLPIKLFD